MDDEEKDTKEVKSMKLVKNIMKVWGNMIESSSKEPFVESIVQFREVCRNYSKFLNYVENNILNTFKKKIVKDMDNPCLTSWQNNH